MSPSQPPNDETLDRALASLPAGTLAAAPSDCPDDRLLVDYRAGSLDEEAAAALERHLATCRDCRDLLLALAEPVPEEVLADARGRFPRPRRLMAWTGAGLALAAALAVAVVSLDRAAPVPSYGLSGPFGGVQAVRALEEASHVFVPASRLKLLIKPEAPVGGEPPKLSVWLSRDGGPLRAAPVQVDAGGGGSYRVQGEARALFGDAPGAWVIHLVLTPGPPPDLAGLPPEQAHARTRGARWLSTPVEYRLEAPPE